jgi:hypothetical protein
MGGGAFSRDVKPLDLDIWWRVDRYGTYTVESNLTWGKTFLFAQKLDSLHGTW